jgi:hypothetical protein
MCFHPLGRRRRKPAAVSSACQSDGRDGFLYILVLRRRQAFHEEGGSQQTESRSNVPSGGIATPAMCNV